MRRYRLLAVVKLPVYVSILEEAGIDIDPRGRVINRGLIESAVYRVGLESTISQKGHRGSLVNRVESIRVDYENG